MMDDRVLVYRGADQPDMSVINPESDVWQNIKIPIDYIANNWPLRCSTISSDGRLIAVAGRRGLIHYSMASGRWKLFEQASQEQSFLVRGGLLWFHHVLIVAIEMASRTYQVQLYSRDNELTLREILHVETFDAPIVSLSLVDNSLLVYTENNDLYHYLVLPTADNVTLHCCGSISFDGVVIEPTLVRGLSWMVPSSQKNFGDVADDMTTATILLLVGGQLDFSKDVKYDMQILADRIEFFWIHIKGIGALENSLWGYDGEALRIWLDALKIGAIPVNNRGPGPVIEHSHLFMNHILRYHLQKKQVKEAVQFALQYQSLVFFSHSLEVLLHMILESEDDVEEEKAILPEAITFLDHFDESLEIVVRCMQRTLDHCLKLNTGVWIGVYARGTPNQLEETSEDAVRLLSQAMERNSSDIAKDLMRFLRSIDEDGTVLKDVLNKMLGPYQTNRRHQPSLPTHLEDEDSRNHPPAVRQYSQPLPVDGYSAPPAPNRLHSYPPESSSNLGGFQPGLPGSAVRNVPYSARLTRETRSQAGLAEEQIETEDDETSSGDEEEQECDFIEEEVLTQSAAEQLERLEWQIMLRSVLDGDVINSEKQRVGIAEIETEPIDTVERFRTQISSEEAWLSYRGKIRKRSLDEEKKRVEHRRLRVGETLHEDVLAFIYNADSGENAVDQLNSYLRRLDAVESFYPTLKAMYHDKPHLKDPAFTKRIYAMTAYANLAGMTRQHLSLLQKWTGSKELDVMALSKTNEIVIRPRRPYSNDYAPEVADDSTFVERVLKEQSLVQIFKKRALVDALQIVARANKVYASFSDEFDAMRLPALWNELRELLTFPIKLMQASLRVQLDYAHRLRDMDILLIDQMMEDFKVSINEACSRKAEYRTLLSGGKYLEDFISDDYDKVVLEAVTTFFGLLHRKLKSGAGSRGSYFRETEFLDSQWGLLDKVASEISGGSVLVAEQLCIVTHRLIVRITDAFDHQIRRPSLLASPVSRFSVITNISNDNVSNEEVPVVKLQIDGEENKSNVVTAYIHMLEEARSAFQVVADHPTANGGSQDKGSSLPPANGSSAKGQSDADLDGVNSLSGAEDDSSTYEPEEISKVDDSKKIDESQDKSPKEPEKVSPYLIVFRPKTPMFWHGRVLLGIDIPTLDLGITDKRLLLISEGGQSRLAIAKSRFAGHFIYEDESRAYSAVEEGDVELALVAYASPVGTLPVQTDQRSHLPAINKELLRVTRATNRLAFKIVESIHPVRKALIGVPGYQDLLQNWFLFAAEHAHQQSPGAEF
ncbi:7275_t:CDS:10, partial [Acaulospora colombiana]